MDIEPTTPAPIWTLIEGETKKSYDAFCMYRDMGKDRSLRKVRHQLGRPEGYTRTLELWSRKYQWVMRVRAYDHHIESLKDAVTTQVVIDNQTMWLRRREEVREVGYEIARQLFDKARQMLAFPITRVTREEEGQDSRGRYVNKITIEPVKWSVRDIGRMADVANKIARLTVDLPTEIIDVCSDLLRLAQKKNVDLLPILKELHHQLSEVG